MQAESISPERALGKRLKLEEGLRLDAYLDVQGRQTIGYGHRFKNCESYTNISKSQALQLLKADIDNATDSVKTVCVAYRIRFDSLPDGARNALVDLCFQLGIDQLSRFSEMLASVRTGDFRTAGLHLMDSRHASVYTCRTLTDYIMLSSPHTVLVTTGFNLPPDQRRRAVCRVIKGAIFRGMLPLVKKAATPLQRAEETKAEQEPARPMPQPSDPGFVWQSIARNCYRHYEPFEEVMIEVPDLGLDLYQIGGAALKNLCPVPAAALGEKENKLISKSHFGPRLGLEKRDSSESDSGSLSSLDSNAGGRASSVVQDELLMDGVGGARHSLGVEKLADPRASSEVPEEELLEPTRVTKTVIPFARIKPKEEQPDLNPVDVRKPFGQRVVSSFLVALSNEVNKIRTAPQKMSVVPGQKVNITSTKFYNAGSMIGGTLGGTLAHADEMTTAEMAKSVATSLAIDTAIAGLAPSVTFTAMKIAASTGSSAAAGIAAGVGKAASKAAPLVGHAITGVMLAVNLSSISQSQALHIGEKWIRAGKCALDIIAGMGAGIGGAMAGAKLGAAIGMAGGPAGFAIGVGGGLIGGLVGGLASRLWNRPMRLRCLEMDRNHFKREACNYDGDFELKWDRIPGDTKSFIIHMVESDGELRWQVINVDPLKRSTRVQNRKDGKVVQPYLGVANRTSEITFQIWALDEMVPEGCDVLEFAQKHLIALAELECRPE